MGAGSWSASTYDSHTRSSIAAGTALGSASSYSGLVSRGAATGVHASLDPKKAAGAGPFAGKTVREARDSDEHPNSLPIAALFDVTGSMANVPVVLQKKLAELFGLVLRKGYAEDPQVLVGAYGDVDTDSYPLQAGQFE